MSNPQSEIPNSKSDFIWALKDVSFEVKQGETLGIIGGNGAGKSTLLKLLSRITEPTDGRAEIYGRVGSLLEVGTGFDRELTGRENIYLNGAILGMTKQEIDRKCDEIVDVSGVERFIDTPVKRYSSGVHVRLAFSVAAHLEPEILIVDEVVKLLGHRDREESIEILAKSHVFVAGSVTALNGDQDGPLNTLKEAMAMGLPVISTQHGGIPELVADGVSGFLVPERDPGAMFDRLAHLIEHPEMWAEMGRAGRAAVEERYDIKKLNDDLIEIYRGLVLAGHMN